MKIHYLSMSTLISPEANAVHVMRMCGALARAGHEVTLHAHRGPGDDHDVFEYFGTEASFALARHPTGGMVTPALGRIVMGGGSPRMRALAKLGLDRRCVRPILKREQPDLVYARNAVALVAARPSVPFIFESHSPPRGRVSIELEKRILRRPGLERIVLISEALRRVYATMFPWVEERMVVAHDAADDPGERPASCGRDGFHVGFVGNLYPGRGGATIAAVAAAMPDVTFHVVGGTPHDLDRFASFVVSDNVVVHGHQPPSSLPAFYADFDVVIAPYESSVSTSRGGVDIGGFLSPMKLFEYMSWGMPMVCSDLPVLREVLVHDDNALLVGPGIVDDWAAAIARLRDDPGLAGRLGRQARADFLARYTWDARASHVLDGLA